MSFTFSRYSYKEGPVWFTYSSLLIRLSFIGLIGYISASNDSVFSSAYILESKYSNRNNFWARKEVFIAI